jgi:hypothetical protein
MIAQRLGRREGSDGTVASTNVTAKSTPEMHKETLNSLGLSDATAAASRRLRFPELSLPTTAIVTFMSIEMASKFVCPSQSKTIQRTWANLGRRGCEIARG